MVDWSNKDYINNIINTSMNKTDVLKKLGLSCFGGNYNTLTMYISVNKIDVSHFETKKATIKRNISIGIENAFVENSSYTNNSNIKKFMYDNGFKKNECELCGLGDVWNGKKITLILDHINGINNDNRISNLRIVCPNCNATLETHCKGHRTFDLNKSVVRVYKKVKKTKCFNTDCSNLISDNAKFCLLCIRNKQSKKPKIDIGDLIKDIVENGFSSCSLKYDVHIKTIKKWYNDYKETNYDDLIIIKKLYNPDFLDKKIIRQRPDYDTLVKEVNEFGFVQTAKKYNVSDNAIRKWIKSYIKNDGKENVLNIKL